jgi:hypothetical protein
VRDVWLVEVAAPLTHVGHELAQTIELALAECPRGVVVELDVPSTQTIPDRLDLVAAAGRHPWAWPAAPVAVASKDPDTKVRLQQHIYGRHLIQCSSVLQGWAQIINTEPPLTARLRLVPNARAPHVARRFVAQTCLDWHLGSRRSDAVAIAGELTTRAVEHAGTDLDVILALSRTRLRIAMRSRRPGASRDQPPDQPLARQDRPLLVRDLAGLTGTLHARDGGKLAWAILGPH